MKKCPATDLLRRQQQEPGSLSDSDLYDIERWMARLGQHEQHAKHDALRKAFSLIEVLLVEIRRNQTKGFS